MNGSLLRGLLNDLKRRTSDAAKELSISPEKLEQMIEGKEAISSDFIQTFCEIYPVNPRDLAPIYDDCPLGAMIFKANESKSSSRVMARAGKDYYEYRDTASSRCSNFRPEWIKELCVVDNNDPENPNAQWNNGHFMHQFTYFVGPVNFYYINSQGQKDVAIMNTGDSMYISPFVPHTFTTRKEDGGEGLILAITFGNLLAGDARFELAALGKSSSSQFVLNSKTSGKMYGDLLRNYMKTMTMPLSTLSDLSDLSVDTIKNHLDGDTLPNFIEIQKIAKALRINIRDLLPFDNIEDKVIVQKYTEDRRWKSEKDGFEIVELACTSNMPDMKSFEITSLSNGDEFMSAPSHQYLYYLGDEPCEFSWIDPKGNKQSETVYPEDSLYIKPFTSHSFSKGGKVLSVRIPGRIAPDAVKELSIIGEQNIDRVILEKEKWFNESGSNGSKNHS